MNKESSIEKLLNEETTDICTEGKYVHGYYIENEK